MRIAVTGASGNVGTALLSALDHEPQVDEIVAICRRPPAPPLTAKARWVAADVTRDDLTESFRGCDAVVHLAWLIQPARDQALMHRVNVDGSTRVFRAAVNAGVASVIHASSVGVYAAGPKERRVDESWPRTGIRSSSYSRDKAAVEAVLDGVARDHPALRIVRVRPALTFQRGASTEVARYFLGPFVPRRLLRPSLIPLVPMPSWLRFQAVHSADVAAAYTAAVLSDFHGPVNLAADPVLDAAVLGDFLRARPVPVPVGALRLAADLSFRLGLQPTDAGWVDLAAESPLLDSSQARAQLGWQPVHTSLDALGELLQGFATGARGPTPVLAARH